MWSHSLAFVDECIAAGKRVEYLPYPMQRHALAGRSREHFLLLLRDWLGRHLRPGERLVEQPKEGTPAEPPKAEPAAPKK
jgi:hypothetical protein